MKITIFAKLRRLGDTFYITIPSKVGIPSCVTNQLKGKQIFEWLSIGKESENKLILKIFVISKEKNNGWKITIPKIIVRLLELKVGEDYMFIFRT